MPRHEQDEAVASALLAAALDFAAAGMPVLPLAGKVPRNRGGLTSASDDVLVVAEWWRRWPDANVGVVTGTRSGYVVLDVDGAAGLRSLAELERRHGKIETAQVLTGSGGRHYWFRAPAGELRNSAGALGEGLDVRGEGGYVVAPPSVHESGNVYRWTRELEHAVAWPEWLIADANERRNGKAAVGEIVEGTRDATLTSFAGSMRRRGMTEPAILAALRVENERCRPPLSERDLERIARSVAGYAPEKVPKDEHLEPFALEVLTARAVCELPPLAAADQLLGPVVVRRQRVTLGAHTGEGKTTLALCIVRAVVSEGEFLDWHGGGGRALVLDAEQGLRTIQRRLHETGLAESELVDYVRVPDGLSLDSDPRHVAEVERVLREGGYALVVIDPLYKLHTGDSNAEREAVDLMRRLDGWREELGFALLLPVHCRKPLPGTKFSIHDLFGSSAYVRGAEVVLGLQRVSDGYARLHFLKDRDGDLPIHTAWGLLFDRENGFRRDPNEGRKPTALDQVRELLADDPELSTAQLVEITGYAERTIRKAARELAEEVPEE